MKNMTITMPSVAECAAEQCVYNVNQQCHARAITVAMSVHPDCTTFLQGPKHTQATQQTAGIGSCKATKCKFNQEYECMADSITVGGEGKKVTCLTFSPAV